MASLNIEDVIELNVGGTFIAAERSVLTSVEASLLEHMFSGTTVMPKVNGRVSIYRNPKTFQLMIDYLADDMLWLPIFENEDDE